jgi:hypothetical protein
MPDPQNPSKHTQVRQIIRDVYGNPILISDWRESLVVTPEGTITRYKEGESIQLVCGTVYNPTMSAGQSPVMLLSVCEICRNPSRFGRRGEHPRHGLCARDMGHLCFGCGQFCCPSHAILGRDNTYRCPRCSGFSLKHFLVNLFYREVE